MKRKLLLKAAAACILAAAILVLAILLVQPVQAGGGVMLRPPFDGTYRLTAYFDHESPNYGDDDYIWIYNGERRPANSQNDNPACTGDPYPYDGHDGWDWSMVTGTHVLAAAAGQVVISQNDYGSWGHTIIIAHDNGYYTMYSHLSQRLVVAGVSVTVGQHIAESGSSGTTAAHLHFGVRHGSYANTNYAIDPFGWRGTGRDPLFNHNGKVSSCLWRSRDEDSISCADTIVEDAGQGSTISGAWNVSTLGNGYHMYYRSTTTDTNIYATWTSTSTIRGPYKVYAYIPSQNATTHNATYWIYTVDGYQDFHIDQLQYSDE
jgi:murein DD-endopeptidase MepM/ murein hydrolase activator NlpD